MSDILLTAREAAADTVEKVREAAEVVERVTTTLENAIRPGVHGVERYAHGQTEPETKYKEPESMKEVILDRVEDVSHPCYLSIH